MHRRTRLALLAPAAAGLLLLSACSSGGSSGSDGSSDQAASCDKADLETYADGVLTVATDTPAFEPWFVDDEPSNGKGFESAVAYAVAKQLGFDKADVKWTTEAFNSAYAPGKKKFDFDINQVSITPERAKAVDFSDGYYDVNQAIVGFSDSKAAKAKTVADLKDLKLGAQQGTTSYDFITEVIKPKQQPFVYNDNSAAKAALTAKQIDGIVLDLPTALYVSAAEIEGSEVIGQFPTTGDKPEQFGMVFEKGNPLRDCVNEALATLQEDGTLDEIQQKWLSDTVAPQISLS
ncbi:MAG: ABC transporter substrate-binding protein [Acidimicrobiales bacterium]